MFFIAGSCDGCPGLGIVHYRAANSRPGLLSDATLLAQTVQGHQHNGRSHRNRGCAFVFRLLFGLILLMFMHMSIEIYFVWSYIYCCLIGIPSADDLISIYCHCRGIPKSLPQQNFFIAMAIFKMAAIAQV